MRGDVFVVLSGGLTFGGSLVLALHELWSLKRRGSGGLPPRPEPPPPPPPRKPLPDCLIPRKLPPWELPSRVRELDLVE